MLLDGGSRAAVAFCPPRRWTSPRRRPAPVPIPPPALSVRVGRCRYGSPSVGCGSAARQGSGLASALCRGRSALCCPLPPSVAAPIRTSGGRTPRPAMSDPPQAAAGQPAQGPDDLRRRAPCTLSRAHSANGPFPRTRARLRLSRPRHRTARQRPPGPGNSRQGHPVTVAQRPRKTAPPCASRAKQSFSRPARAVVWRKRWAHAPFELVFFPASNVGESREKNLMIFVERRVTRKHYSRLLVGDFVTWRGGKPHRLSRRECYGYAE